MKFVQSMGFVLIKITKLGKSVTLFWHDTRIKVVEGSEIQGKYGQGQGILMVCQVIEFQSQRSLCLYLR